MSQFSNVDRTMMARAIELAALGTYTTKPNPMVGCVIAHGERIVGEGFHQRAGEPHAERFALRAAGEMARGATAYVTLEPCAHHGRTPPCADALVAAGITRVIAAQRDPFAQVDGRGFTKLEAAGVEVQQGLLEAEARELNRGFLSRLERGRPWLRLKLAMSLDGRTALASGESKWITSEPARLDVQHWRARCGALLTGSGTVLADDPQLTVRLPESVDYLPPLRVVLDSFGKITANARIFSLEAPTLAVHASDIVPRYQEGIDAIAVPRSEGRLDLSAMLAQLAQRSVNEVQVEAGATLSGALLKAGLIDELLLYIAPVVLGDHGRPLFAGLDIPSMANRLGFRILESVPIGPDLRLLMRPE